jgi:hypothetical protein
MDPLIYPEPLYKRYIMYRVDSATKPAEGYSRGVQNKAKGEREKRKEAELKI